MAIPKWFCIAIMALMLSLAVCTAHRNLPGMKTDNAQIFDNPPMTMFPPDFYRNCGGGVGGGSCDDCCETPHDGGCGDCGDTGGDEGGCGGFGGGCGSGGDGYIPPQFTIPFPWFYIPGFPPLNEPYQCCPSSCGNSQDHCPRFTLHLTHDKPNPVGSKFLIPGFAPLNGIYECCPRSCACENPHRCPGFTMYSNFGTPVHNNEGDHDTTRPVMSTILAMAPASN